MGSIKRFTGFLLSMLFIGVINSTSFAYSDMITPSFIKNYRYYNNYYNDFVTLKNGKFVKIEKSGVTQFTTNVFIVKYLIAKTANHQPVAAVILGASGGGSGYFLEMNILYQKGDKVYQLKPIDLGDRVNIQKIVFTPGKINKFTVIYYDHGPNDSMCCPSKYTTKTINVNTN